MAKWSKIAVFGGALMSAAAAGALEEVPAVPSGHSLTLQEVLVDQATEQSVLRLRYVMPAIAEKSLGYNDLLADFEHLCETQAVPEALAQPTPIQQIVISLSDQETEFGVSNPDATQYFEAFNLETDICIWEGF